MSDQSEEHWITVLEFDIVCRTEWFGPEDCIFALLALSNVGADTLARPGDFETTC